MRKKITKADLCEAESLLADAARLYLDREDSKAGNTEEIARGVVSLALSLLINFHAQVRRSPHPRSLWVQNVELSSVSVAQRETIFAQGNIYWMDEDENEDSKIKETFDLFVSLSSTSSAAHYEITIYSAKDFILSNSWLRL